MVAFSGGDKLRAKLKELAAQVKRGAKVQIGFQDGATYPDGTSVALVAALNEFGVPDHNQPPRPYFRGMIAKESDHWGDDIAAALTHTNYDAQVSLALVGEQVAGELRQSITDLVDPPLAPSTIARKGFGKPLVDTGRMRNSITAVVKDET